MRAPALFISFSQNLQSPTASSSLCRIGVVGWIRTRSLHSNNPVFLVFFFFLSFARPSIIQRNSTLGPRLNALSLFLLSAAGFEPPTHLFTRACTMVPGCMVSYGLPQRLRLPIRGQLPCSRYSPSFQRGIGVEGTTQRASSCFKSPKSGKCHTFLAKPTSLFSSTASFPRGPCSLAPGLPCTKAFCPYR